MGRQSCYMETLQTLLKLISSVTKSLNAENMCVLCSVVNIYILFSNAQTMTAMRRVSGVSAPHPLLTSTLHRGETSLRWDARHAGLLLWCLHFSSVFLPRVSRSVFKLNIVCVLCQCLRVYFFGDIFKEWFGACESQVSLLMPFYSRPTNSVSFQCNYDLLDLNHWPVQTTAI